MIENQDWQTWQDATTSEMLVGLRYWEAFDFIHMPTLQEVREYREVLDMLIWCTPGNYLGGTSDDG